MVTPAVTIGASLISTLLRPAVDRAMLVAVEECEYMFHIHKEITNLRNTLLLIEVVLQDAEERQSADSRIYHWLKQLDDIALDADRVLDEFVTDAAVKARTTEVERRNGRMKQVTGCFFSCFTCSCTRFRIAHNIRDINKRLDVMKRQSEILNLRVSGEIERIVANRPETGAFDNTENLFLGRDRPKKAIMATLWKPDDRAHFFPIWGMGGIGKTTLAQSIYNDDSIKDEDYPRKNRKWLFVGEKEFDAKKLMKDIVEKSNHTSDNVATLQEALVQKFKGGRFLIVIDDVWSIKITEWEIFWRALAKVGKGGVVIMTTRIREVIVATGSRVPEPLAPLSDDECWQIFEKRAFAGRSASDRPDLKVIGLEIVRKLNGLPLAVDIVGNSLLNESDSETWRSFLDNEQWMFTTNPSDIMPAMKWSYNHLPSHLKPCFAYCCIFPKDHMFDVSNLIKMWMAHNFIKTRGNQRPEDVGHAYFMELLHASLFQCISGKYVMHDMIHDLAQLVSNEQCLIMDGEMPNRVPENIRHLSIYFDECNSNYLNLCKGNRLLTLLATGKSISRPLIPPSVVKHLFIELTCIRVLVLHHVKITEIPDSISELKHIRYLDLQNSILNNLPESLCELHNLQTLMAPYDTCLPRNMGNLINLRHLVGNPTVSTGVGKLTSLQQLSSIRIDGGEKIGELQNLKDLHGQLRITGLENVSTREDAVQFMVQGKLHIHKLELVFHENSGSTKQRNCVLEEEVLNALQPPLHLDYLEIHSYIGLKSPSWMVGRHLSNLQTLSLSHNVQWELLPPLGELYSLKYLYVHSMHGVKSVGHEFYGKRNDGKVFPSLVFLSLEDLIGWEEWVGVKDEASLIFPCLQKLDIKNCPLLATVPLVQDTVLPKPNNKWLVQQLMRSLTRLDIRECNGLTSLKMEGLASLKDLLIIDCSNLVVLTMPTNAVIQDLSIIRCKKLTTAEFGHLPSLRDFYVSSCLKLTALPHLVAIEDLQIQDCPELTFVSFGLEGLLSLEELSILRCPKLSSSIMEVVSSSSPPSSLSPETSRLTLPKLQMLQTDNKDILTKLLRYNLTSLITMLILNCSELACFSGIEEEQWQRLKSLQYLTVRGCDNLMSLPSVLRNLASLIDLRIIYCPQLQKLPDGGLPLSLEFLSIERCPLLEERCQKDEGLDWHKIKHISKIHIVTKRTIIGPVYVDDSTDSWYIYE